MKLYIEKLISRLENYKITVTSYILTLLSISLVRNFFEGMLEQTKSIGITVSGLKTFLYMGVLYNLEWAGLLTALAAVFSAVTGEKIERIFKITLIFFVWILIVPFIDYFVYFPNGYNIAYLYRTSDYLRALAYFFAPWVDIKISFGVRFEVFVSFILALIYILIKTGKFSRALIAAAVLYFLAVSSMAFPVFILTPAWLFSVNHNVFINNFFTGPSIASASTGREAVMVSLLLSVILLTCMLLHENWKIKAGNFIHAAEPFLFPVFFIAGVLPSIKYINPSGYVLFSNPFDFAYISAGVLLSIMLGISAFASGRRSSIPPYVFPVSVTFALLISASISFEVFLCCAAFFALLYILNYSPFPGIAPAPVSAALRSLGCIFVMITGFVSISGASSPMNIYPPYFIFAFLVVFMIELSFKSEHLNTFSICLMAAYMLFPPFFRSLLVFIIASAAGLLSAFIFYYLKYPARNLLRNFLFLIFSFFILLLASLHI